MRSVISRLTLSATMLIATVFFSVSSWSIEPGLYISHDMKLGNINIEPFGNGAKLKTCGSFANKYCFAVESIIYPEGPLWGGEGTFVVKYGDKKPTVCTYETRFKIKQVGQELKVDYYGPSFLPSYIKGSRCPSVAKVKPEWSAIERNFVFAKPCLPNPIFQKSECVGGVQ